MAAAVWFGCSNVAREVVGERAIYRRERMGRLRPGAYLLSKVLLQGLLIGVQVGILLAVLVPRSWWTRPKAPPRAPLRLSTSYGILTSMLTSATVAGSTRVLVETVGPTSGLLGCPHDSPLAACRPGAPQSNARPWLRQLRGPPSPTQSNATHQSRWAAHGLFRSQPV